MAACIRDCIAYGAGGGDDTGTEKTVDRNCDGTNWSVDGFLRALSGVEGECCNDMDTDREGNDIMGEGNGNRERAIRTLV